MRSPVAQNAGTVTRTITILFSLGADSLDPRVWANSVRLTHRPLLMGMAILVPTVKCFKSLHLGRTNLGLISSFLDFDSKFGIITADVTAVQPTISQLRL